jgi:hypothetical protein
VEIDLLGGGEGSGSGGLGLEPSLMIPCKIVYNAWDILLEPLGLIIQEYMAWRASSLSYRWKVIMRLQSILN